MDIDPNVTKAAPGAVGALIALHFIRGPTWRHNAIAFLGGCACAWFGVDNAVRWTGAGAGLSGFVLGLFGMAVVSKLHEAIVEFKPGELITGILKKWGVL